MSVDAIERLEQIQARLDVAGRVRIGELAASFGVSEMTVRRDLDTLAEQGVLSRVRGGAVAFGPQPFGERFEKHGRAKDRIAAKLAPMVVADGAIGLDASTTMQRFASKLGGLRDLTVMTNGLECFAALQSAKGVQSLLTGGRLDPRTGSLVGPLASRSVGDLVLRQVFISAAALDPTVGTTETTLEDAEAKLAFTSVAAEVVVAVDSSKLGRQATSRCLPLDQISCLVTELDPRDARLDPYRDAVHIA